MSNLYKLYEELQKFLDAQDTENMSEDEKQRLHQAFMDQYYADHSDEDIDMGGDLDAEDEADPDADQNFYEEDEDYDDPDFDDDDYEYDDFENFSSFFDFLIRRGGYEIDDSMYDVTERIEELSDSALEDADSLEDYLNNLEEAVDEATEIMESEGYLDEDIGFFWKILETRPYMRLLATYADRLTAAKKYSDAAEMYEWMLELNPDDNQGVRYRLLPVYIIMNAEQNKIDELLSQYEDSREHSAFFLMALAYHHYTEGEPDAAAECLKKLCASNEDTLTFFNAIVTGDLDQYRQNMEMIGLGYRPYTIDEFIMVIDESPFLYENADDFYRWGQQIVRGFANETASNI